MLFGEYIIISVDFVSLHSNILSLHTSLYISQAYPSTIPSLVIKPLLTIVLKTLHVKSIPTVLSASMRVEVLICLSTLTQHLLVHQMMKMGVKYTLMRIKITQFQLVIVSKVMHFLAAMLSSLPLMILIRLWIRGQAASHPSIIWLRPRKRIHSSTSTVYQGGKAVSQPRIDGSQVFIRFNTTMYVSF